MSDPTDPTAEGGEGGPRTPTRLRVGEAVEAHFDRMDLFGVGVGTPAGHALPEIHCPGVHPNERASVRVLAIAKRARPVRAHTKLIEIQAAHPARREPPCPQHESGEGRCGGCPLMTLDEAAQRETKQARIVEALGLRVDAYHPAPEALGYRWSAKRIVGGRRGALRFGSYLRGSHRVADMGGCRVDHPRIVAAFEQLLARADSMQITSWRAPGDGELRYVWAKTNGDAVLLTLLGSATGLPRLRSLARSLKSVEGVYVAARESTGNALRGGADEDPLEHVCGLEALPYPDAGVHEGLGPLGFLQPNPRVASAAYDALIAGPNGDTISGELAFDLYAGAGVTTTRLRRHFARVRPVESYPESASALGVAPETAAEFLARYEGERPQLVVANPPRAGLGGDCCTELMRLKAPRLHVMSCSPDSFRRDLERLSPVYELERIELFDTLPQTAHVELLAWLRLKSD